MCAASSSETLAGRLFKEFCRPPFRIPPSQSSVLFCSTHLYEHFPDPDATNGSHAAIKTALDRASEDDGGFTGGFGVLSGGFGISSRGASTALSRLARDALESDPTRPEPWVAAALYQVSKGSNVRALDYAQRAIAPDCERTVPCSVSAGSEPSG